MTELLRNQIIGNTPRSFIFPKPEDLGVTLAQSGPPSVHTPGPPKQFRN
ncbi:MAG: hypothetical protein ACJAZ9_000116 [Neolewinella sp.]|jgi:hypothetical protein